MQVSSLLSNDERKPSRTQMARPKSVSFELLLDEGSKTRARIPLRVLLNSHDTTESIITTVKNFYGIYDGHGVSFDDGSGNTLIASHDNLAHNSTVYVRIVPAALTGPNPHTHTSSFGTEQAYEPRRRPSLGEPFNMLPPHMREQSHSPSRSASRLARKRSTSPTQGRGRRSASQQKGTSHAPSRGSSANGSFHEDTGYSDSEAGRSSISGSKKARSEHFASSDISMANVVQDGRRGGPMFDSSTLPLFVPPQVPVTASQSSISPQRRLLPHEAPSPFPPPSQNLYGVDPIPAFSPQSLGAQPSGYSYGQSTGFSGAPLAAPQHGHRLRDRSSMPQIYPGRPGYSANGVLPTPDPTVASCISDEDVARTLIALGDASNHSHGRTSNSTLGDETFSAAADAASSTGATSESEEDSEVEDGQPKDKKYTEDEDDEYAQGSSVKGEHDDLDGPPKTKKIKTKMHDGPTYGYRPKAPTSSNKSKSSKPRSNTMPKAIKPSLPGLMKAPSAPSPNGQARKSSGSSLTFQHPLGADEEDLSAKPRCQRCRKSKKGCDRQRPCGRCKDAGIGVDGCVSEDEGNGRKGRYGRHMGVIVKKGAEEYSPESEVLMTGHEMSPEAMDLPGSIDKSKKRKR